MVSMYKNNDKELDRMAGTVGNVVGLFGGGAIAVENIRAVPLARKRKSQENLNTREF